MVAAPINLLSKLAIEETRNDSVNLPDHQTFSIPPTLHEDQGQLPSVKMVTLLLACWPLGSYNLTFNGTHSVLLVEWPLLKNRISLCSESTNAWTRSIISLSGSLKGW